MATLATLETYLTEAEAALHKLRIGSQEQEVSQSGAGSDLRVKYTPAQAGELAAYIESLKTQIAALGGTVTGQKRRSLDVNL